MQWILLMVWGGGVALCPKERLSLARHAVAAGLIASMLTQEALLWADGMLNLQTGLPLHLCGLAGVLSIPLLYRARGGAVHGLIAYLAAPAAAAVLFFPAVMQCSHPMLMGLAFFRLHVLVALVPFLLWRMQKPLPVNPRGALVLGNGYLLAVEGVNTLLHTNYLFLRAAPAGTPLAWLMGRGKGVYVAALEVTAMALAACLAPLYRRLNRLIAGNRSACSRYVPDTAPCTIRRRGSAR